MFISSIADRLWLPSMELLVLEGEEGVEVQMGLFCLADLIDSSLFTEEHGDKLERRSESGGERGAWTLGLTGDEKGEGQLGGGDRRLALDFRGFLDFLLFPDLMSGLH